MELLIKRKNKFVAIVVVLLLILSAVGGIIYGKHKESVVAEAQAPLITQTQAMNGVDKNIEFEFASDKDVNAENWRSFVEIKDIVGNIPECRFRKTDDKKFLIKAPLNGYMEGGNYIIQIKDAYFAQEGIDSTKPFYFSIDHKTIENVVFASNVVEVDKDNIINFDGNCITTCNISYSVGDILNFTYLIKNEWGAYSAKIEQITSIEGDLITATVSTPEETEVTPQKEIYGTYCGN